MRFLRTTCFVGALGFLLLTQTGCVLFAVGAACGAGIYYVRGASVMELEGSPTQVATAAQQALSDNGVAVISSNVSENCAKITGRTSCDDKVCVEIEPGACNASKVEVRLGVFGDRYFQNRILSRISEILTGHPAEPCAEPCPEPAPEPPAEPVPPETRDGNR